MRMRRKKILNDRLKRVSSLIVENPTEEGQLGGTLGLKTHTPRDRMRQGKFICDMAEANPDIFYIAMEKVANVLIAAVEMAFENNLSNVLFIRGDAALLSDYFAQGEVSRLYLNFSDPGQRTVIVTGG